MVLKVEVINPSAGLESGTICIGAQASMIRPKHALVFNRETEGENFSALHATSGNVQYHSSSESQQEKEFLRRPGIRAFKISDPENPGLLTSFINTMRGSEVRFSVFKVASSLIRDAFSSEKTRENEVADHIAKYFYKAHAQGAYLSSDERKANVFCSQFVCQSLQTSMAQEAVGKENLGLNRHGKISEDFDSWRKKHIGKIRDAVKGFPPEFKHISSSMTPDRLIAALDAVASRSAETTASKLAHVTSESEEIDAPTLEKTASDKPNPTCKPTAFSRLANLFTRATTR